MIDLAKGNALNVIKQMEQEGIVVKATKRD